MRQFSGSLAQNLGNGALGEVFDLTGRITWNGLGSLKQAIEKELTKLDPSDISLRIRDEDGAAWAWIQANVQTEDGFYPPFLSLEVDGERFFLGTVDPSRMEQDTDKPEVSLTSQDWSLMLASKPLDDWERPRAKAPANRPQVTHPGEAPLVGVLSECKGAPSYRNMVAVLEPMNWAVVGDLLDATLFSGANFSGLKIVKIDHHVDASLSANGNDSAVLTLNQDIWPVGQPFEAYQGQFQREATDLDEVGYYQVAKDVGSDGKVYEIELDCIDGLVPGDVLHLPQSDRDQSYTLLQVDAASGKVITREEVRDLAAGDRFYLSDDSQKELVYEDVRAILRRACQPYSCDLSRLQMPTLPVPVLVWLPLRPAVGVDLTSLKDMDAGLATLRVYGYGSLAWEGTPEAGWQKASEASPKAYWTNQLVAAPSSLMPEETQDLVPTSPARFRPSDLRWRQTIKYVQAFDGREVPDPNQVWDPESAANPEGVVVYDYLQMRRVVVRGTDVQIVPWTGAAWGQVTTLAWAGGQEILSASVMPGTPGAILGLRPDGLQLATLPGGGFSPILAIPVAAADAVLQTTPWGAFLVGSKGYGRVTYAGGALALAWITLLPEGGALYPTTFAGLSDTEAVVLARVESTDSSGQNTTTETHLLRLSVSPTTVEASVLASEKILDGAPRTCGLLRDPSQAGRVVGHCGGRLFQVSRTLPACYALERFKPEGMTAGELIEHVSQVIQTVAVPDPSGTLHIISRTAAAAPVALQVDKVKVISTRAWEHFYSTVRVSGQGEDLYADAYGSQDGGKYLEYSGHPFIWTVSGAQAMAEAAVAWFGVPRRVQQQTWFWTDTSSAAPWESLPPFSRVTLNGDPQVWLVIAMTDEKAAGRAQVTLLEVF